MLDEGKRPIFLEFPGVLVKRRLPALKHLNTGAQGHHQRVAGAKSASSYKHCQEWPTVFHGRKTYSQAIFIGLKTSGVSQNIRTFLTLI